VRPSCQPAGAAAAAPRRLRPRWSEALAWAALLLLAACVPLFVCMPLTPDTILYDLCARNVMRGGVPY
jgi:hypothetical protein